MFLGDYFLTITFTYKYFPLSVRQMRVLQWDRHLALLFLKGIHPQGCDAEIKCSLPFQAFTFRHSLCPYSTLWRLPLRLWYIFSSCHVETIIAVMRGSFVLHQYYVSTLAQFHEAILMYCASILV